MKTKPLNINASRNGIRKLIVHSALYISLFFVFGCQSQPPAGSVIQPMTLGTVVDQLNLQQEENAEFAKFIIYNHEFEINLQDEFELQSEDQRPPSKFDYKPTHRIRGFRLTPAGESHVRQIASHLLNQPMESMPYVVVQQSDTSKRWETRHRYPVHHNDELDNIRRQVVVNVLLALGVSHAEEIVVVAPAYPSGLNAQEAAAAYQSAMGNNGPTSNNFFGR